MTKKRAIVSYEKLSIEQKKQLLVAFPDGFASGMTQIKTPTGETLDALLWETEEIIYLVKIPKPTLKSKVVEDDEEEFDDLPKLDDVKADDDDEFDEKDEEDDYDKAEEEEDDEDE